MNSSEAYFVSDSGPVAPSRGAICFVTNDLDYFQRNGGIGTYNWQMARLLAANGWKVVVLYCADWQEFDDRERIDALIREAGFTVYLINDFEPSPELMTPHAIHQPWPIPRSDHVRDALEQLHREHRFDLIEFVEWQAPGFRPIQAKRMGLAFQDATLMVKLHSSSQWMREGNCHWPSGFTDLVVDYAERYAFDHADEQLAPTRYMVDYAKSIGWSARDDVKVMPYPFPESASEEVGDNADLRVREIVFFGRLETRKGLEVFLDAVSTLPDDIAVTFLGRENILADGRSAINAIEKELADRSHQILDSHNREEALAYLAQGGRLAVMPSLSDNAPFAVIEAAAHRIMFIAAGVGGVPEVLTDERLADAILFAPTSRGLAKSLKEAIARRPEEWRELLEIAARQVNTSANHRNVLAAYESLLETHRLKRPESTSPARAKDAPLVSLVVPYFNLPEYLPACVEAIADQTYPNLDVMVINDGSTDPEANAVFEEQRRRWPEFRFLNQANQGIGATRNRGLAEARGDYFLPVDADNLPLPRMVEAFVSAIERRPDVSALTCYLLMFKDEEEIEENEFSLAYRPIGGAIVAGAVDNVFGDANAIFRTEDFRSVGGYETDRDTSWEDFEAFAKLVLAGFRLDVLPEYLVHYRVRTESWSRVTSRYKNHRRLLRQYVREDLNLPTAERLGLWNTVVAMHAQNSVLAKRVVELEHELKCLKKHFGQARFRLADTLNTGLKIAPLAHWLLKSSFSTVGSRTPDDADAPPGRSSARPSAK